MILISHFSWFMPFLAFPVEQVARFYISLAICLPDLGNVHNRQALLLQKIIEGLEV